MLSRLLPWVVLLTGVVLGVFGFHALHPSESWWSCAYLAVQLITLNSGGVEGPLPWELEVGRWMAPMATVWAIIATFAKSTRQLLGTWWISRRWRGHAIICGAGDTGSYVARTLADAGNRVLVIEIDPSAEALPELRAHRVQVCIADAREIASLHNLGHDRAALLFASLGRDEDNVALSISAALRGSDTDALSDTPRIYTHLRDERMAAVIEDPRIWPSDSPVRRIRAFNRYRNAARELLALTPLEIVSSSDGVRTCAGEVHVVIGSFDAFTEAIAVQVASVGHYRGGRKTTIHLAMPEASRVMTSLRAAHPQLAACCELITHDVPVQQWVPLVKGLVATSSTDSVWTVLPGFASHADSFVRGLSLAGSVSPELSRRLRIVVGTQQGSAMQSVVGRASAAARALLFLPTTESRGGLEAVLGDRLDAIARNVHETWLAKQRALAAEADASGNHAESVRIRAKASFREWRDLSEEERQFNRSQADHLLIKLRAIACQKGRHGLDAAVSVVEQALRSAVVERPSGNILDEALAQIEDAWRSLSDEETEELARLEHFRWCTQLWLAGWQYAVDRDDRSRRHSDLVDYDRLSESVKDYDRDAVRAVPSHVRSAVFATA